MTAIALVVAATASAAQLALGMLLAGETLAGILALLLAPAWWYASRRPLQGAPLLLLIASLAGAGYASVHGAAPSILLGAAVAALMATDLHAFLERIRQVENLDPNVELEARHLRRILLVGAMGLGLGLAAMRVEVKLGLAGALALGLLAIIGFSQAVRYLRQQQG